MSVSMHHLKVRRFCDGCTRGMTVPATLRLPSARRRVATFALGTGESTALPGAPSANTRRRIVVKSEPAAVTTQDAVDGYREKAMRIASVEQVELGSIMDLSITGQVLKWVRR